MKSAVIIIIILLIFTFPFSAGFGFYYDKNLKYINCAIYIYNKIKVLKASIKLEKKYLNLYIFGTRIQIEYKKMFSDRKKFDILKGFELDEIKLETHLGYKENKILPIAIGGLVSQASSIILSILKEKNKTLSAYSKFNIHENVDIFKIKFKISILFNFLLILIAVIKKITEKIMNGKRKSK